VAKCHKNIFTRKMITPSTQSHQSGVSLVQLKNRQALEYGFEYSFEDLHHTSSTEQHRIFESLYQEAEIQDVICNRRGRNTTRRASMQNISYHEAATSVGVKRYRRHSTFNPRNRQAHRDTLADFQDYMLHQRNRQRSSIVSTLLDFHSSFEISMVASFRKDVKPALYLSCPVLSYMHDSDEDSIEIRRVKRSSLISNPKENQNFEYLDDCIESDSDISFDVSSQPKQQEYIVDMSEIEGFPCLRPRKRRQRHSYKELERRLSTESHLAILKSFIMSETDEVSIGEFEDMTNNEVKFTSTSKGLEDPGGTFQTASARTA
jgi:hypothetical protein